MVLVKASKDTEAGVIPTQQMWKEMEQFNEELVKAKTMLVGEGLHPSSKGLCSLLRTGPYRYGRPVCRDQGVDSRYKNFRTPLIKLLDKLSRISKETFHADFP